MINAFEIAINFYQGCLIVYFCDKYYVGKRNWSLAALCILLAGIFLSVHQIMCLPIPDTLVFFAGYSYLHFTKRSSIGGRIFCCVLLAAIWIASATVFNSVLQYIFKINLTVIFQNTKSRVLYLITFNALITILIFAICNLIKKKQSLRIPINCSLIFIVLLSVEWITAEFLFSYIMRYEVSVEPLLVFSIAALLFIIVLSIILYEYFCDILNRTIYAENTARMLKDAQKHQSEIKNMYRAMLKNQHDFKHRIAAAEAMLLKNGETSSETIKKLLMDDKTSNDFFLTGNESMDALLTIKQETARTYGISFRYQPYPLTRLPIDEISFCVLISNLLDNAIQELSEIDNNFLERYIELKLSKSMDMFCVTCINPTSTEKKDISTTAIKIKQYSGHGYGLESIRRTVEENQGIIQINSQDYIFRVDIMLPMEGDNNYDDGNPCKQDNGTI